MKDDWALVRRGFGVAIVGYVGVVCYILGLSNLYVGRYGVGGGCLVAAILFLYVFRRILSPYLDVLIARWQSIESEGDS